MPSTGRCQGTVSFASTLYLCPILDLLLAEVPVALHPELRLGLQEALVNAAKHGNQLDPGKTITVEFSFSKDIYWWTISDRGNEAFKPEACCCASAEEHSLPDDTSECGRGLYILNQIFDRVEWTPQKRQLRLGKLVPRNPRRLKS